MQLNEWLTAHEVAEYASIPYPHLWTYQKRGILPMPDHYIGNKPLWSRSLIESWHFEWNRRTRKERNEQETTTRT